MQDTNAGSIGGAFMLFVAGAASAVCWLPSTRPRPPELREIEGPGSPARNKAEGLPGMPRGLDNLKGKAGRRGSGQADWRDAKR